MSKSNPGDASELWARIADAIVEALRKAYTLAQDTDEAYVAKPRELRQAGSSIPRRRAASFSRS